MGGWGWGWGWGWAVEGGEGVSALMRLVAEVWVGR